MNAAELITKPARALVLASGLVAAASIVGFAQDVTVGLGTLATLPIANAYVNPPTGVTSLGGHQFDLSSGNMIPLASGQSASISGSYPNTTAVYVLINSYNTYTPAQPIGQIGFTFSDGTTQTTTLTTGSNVREWRPGANTVNTASDPNLANVWTGQAQAATGGGTAIIDMLTIPVTNRTLTNITISINNTFGTGVIVSGITIDPTAQTICVRPGNSLSACGHSQAAGHAQSANFSTTGPTAPGQLARMDGTPANANTKDKDHGTHGHKAQ